MRLSPILALLVVTSPPLATRVASATPEPLHIASRLELFIDDYLIDHLNGSRLHLHEPTPSGIVMRFDSPWEGSFSAYITILRDGDRLRMYYRGLPSAGGDNSAKEVTCYAESKDGIAWTKPSLGLFEVQGTRDNNVVLAFDPPFSSNFAPFVDSRSGVAPNERFKALAGSSKTGLFLFASGDGIHWKKVQSTAVIQGAPFDSQNVAFWSPAENCYALYFRTWSGGPFTGFRTISRSTSTNLLQWSPGQGMTFGDAPSEHLYTSQTHPYFRAPHIYIATPMRFVPDRKVLSEEQVRSNSVSKKGMRGIVRISF